MFEAAVLADGPDATVQDVFGALGGDDGEWKAAAQDALGDDHFSEQLQEALSDLNAQEHAWLRTPEPVQLEAPLPTGDAAQLAGGDGRALRAARRVMGPGISHVIFGHTHQVADGERALYFNPGSWLPYLNLRAPEVCAHVQEKGLMPTIANSALYSQRRHAIHIELRGTRPRVQLI